MNARSQYSWKATVVLSILLCISALSYLFHSETIAGIEELGFPSSFRIQLSIMKLVAVVVLLAPKAPKIFKHWALGGTFCFIVTAMVAHIVHGDPLMITVFLILAMVLTAVSAFEVSRDNG